MKGNHNTLAHRMVFVINRSRYTEKINLDLVRRIIVIHPVPLEFNSARYLDLSALKNGGSAKDQAIEVFENQVGDVVRAVCEEEVCERRRSLRETIH